MVNEVITQAIESTLEPKVIYRELCDISSIPLWAPAFADAVKPIQENVFRVTKDEDTFDMELVANGLALTVDYLRSMPHGRRGGAYIRVMPRPAGGSVVVMTVPVGPNNNPEQVANVLNQELQALIRLTLIKG